MLGVLHPLPKLIVCVVWIVTAITLFDLRFQLFTIGLAATLLIVLERRSLIFVIGLMVPFALFGAGFLTTSLLFRQEADFALTLSAEQTFARPEVSAGLVLFFRAIACGMVSALFALTTDPGQLVRALMIHARLPATVGFALLQALNLVPDLAREAQQIRLARAMMRGRRPRRIPGPVEGVSLLVPLLAFAIRRAGRAALAMEARGLKAGAPRSHLNRPQAGWADLLFVCCAVGFLAGGICLAVLY